MQLITRSQHLAYLLLDQKDQDLTRLIYLKRQSNVELRERTTPEKRKSDGNCGAQRIICTPPKAVFFLFGQPDALPGQVGGGFGRFSSFMTLALRAARFNCPQKAYLLAVFAEQTGTRVWHDACKGFAMRLENARVRLEEGVRISVFRFV